jgi:hypothetical protein
MLDLGDPEPTFHTAECLIALGLPAEAREALDLVVRQTRERPERRAMHERAAGDARGPGALMVERVTGGQSTPPPTTVTEQPPPTTTGAHDPGRSQDARGAAEAPRRAAEQCQGLGGRAGPGRRAPPRSSVRPWIFSADELASLLATLSQKNEEGQLKMARTGIEIAKDQKAQFHAEAIRS